MLYNLKRIRTNKGLTLQELSTKTGLSVSYLSELENQLRYNPSYQTMRKLQKALKTSITEIEGVYYGK